ncbi:tetratricopeptide repeat protein [Microseira wollei]|uniref:TPR repeat protein n=1 Tax=Microseira wollei NIES-4236 TaxID=2530354 RepID=A0AAV3WFI0_9CYAN|nr:tetratricopeptide repeat protein [Microseira wollei]GET36624.1 TPR repeat protein [Microseira wollei NIES-4236]
MTEVVALGGLGNAYWATGNYEQALASVAASLKIARELSGGEALIVTALNNLGNVYGSRADRYRYQANVATIEGDEKEASRLNDLAQKDIATAIASFEQSVQVATLAGKTNNIRIAQVKALLNLNRLLGGMAAPNWDLIANNRGRILSILAQLPDSRDKVYALINLASARQREQEAARLLGGEIASARNINDARAESFALGSLGHLYEESRQYVEAMELTQQAQFAAQKTLAADSLYRWQWQAGRIFKVTGDSPKGRSASRNRTRAIASYESAIATLQSIRGDILVANKDLQFNFRDSVEPVYRELMGLLLETGNEKETANYQTNLSQTIKIITQVASYLFRAEDRLMANS